MQRSDPLQVVFYKTETGNEPVREWLRSLLKGEKKLIGEDLDLARKRMKDIKGGQENEK